MTQAAPWAVEQARERWMVDIAALAPDADVSMREGEGQLVIRGWTEPHRAYHSLRHVLEMLHAVAEMTRHGPSPSERGLACARIAVWYHDLAYDPRAAPGSNEHRSASLARDHLHRLGVGPDDVDVVEALILMTIEHDVPGVAAGEGVDQLLMDVFHDADLWILSAPALRYAEYTRQVRQEYDHVPRVLFTHGRSRVLRGFADRKHLYRTEYARRSWTSAARHNIAGELAELSGA
ncbi:MAG: hypothetical protein WA892_09780 [Ornithinimicrobium sp.]